MALCGWSAARRIAMGRRLIGRLSRGGTRKILPIRLAGNPAAKASGTRIGKVRVRTTIFRSSR
jgi:hypothetical protein